MKRKDIFGWREFLALCALVAVFAAGCSGFGESDEEAAGPSFRYALVACADWAGQNSLAAIQLKPAANPRPWMDYLVDLGDDVWLDPVVRTNDRSGQHRAFVIQREYGSANLGTIAVLDPGARFQVAGRYPVNDGINFANPHDLLVLSADKAYVTRWDWLYNDILILDPDTGATSGTIDFTGKGTNADGLPRLHKMLYLQGRVWILMQNIDKSWNYSPGLVAVVNPLTDEIEDIISLNLKNPTDLAYDTEVNRLYVAATGDWFDPATGGIEAINPFSHTSVGVLIHGEDLGGFITDMALLDSRNAYLAVYKADFSGTKVVHVNPTTGTLVKTLYEYPGFFLTDDPSALALDERQNLLIADKTGFRVVVLDLKSGLITDTIETLVPPVSIAIWEGEDKL